MNSVGGWKSERGASGWEKRKGIDHSLPSIKQRLKDCTSREGYEKGTGTSGAPAHLNIEVLAMATHAQASFIQNTRLHSRRRNNPLKCNGYTTI